MPNVVISPLASPPTAATSALAGHDTAFHAVLSALNPLQYVPVVGTIYRAATGDQIDDGVRRLGSILLSGLLGGPVGIAIDVGMLSVEKLSGIDLDQIGQNVLTGHSPAIPAQTGGAEASRVRLAHAAYGRVARQAG